ncbi:MAG: efflux RND transporter permease subunit [Desulfosarcina sp.]
MTFSDFFIQRPIFATVIAIIMVLVGGVAMMALPIQQYPNVVPPTVSVQATFPGANAETVSQTVAAPLAEAINGVEKMIYMTSTSSDNGMMRMEVAFAIGSDGDTNTINVNNRVQSALSRLPASVQAQGINVELRSSNILLLAALRSPNGQYSKTYMQNYAALNIVDELRRLPGVGEAEVLGGSEFAMRIWLDPDKLAQYDLTPTEVADAIRAQNTEVPAGSLAAEPQSDPRAYTYTISAGGRLASAQEFRTIYLRTNPDGSALYLKDVARIELGSSSYAVTSHLNGAIMSPIIINQQPEANALETAANVREALQRLSERFPAGLEYVVPYDTTLFIDASVNAVLETFIEAFVIVAVIVFLFLQNWRSTLIAMTVVPVSVVGTFAGLYLLDFSINLLSLFAMILAIGIVVDDAILVVENVARLLEQNEKIAISEAVSEGMREVGGPVIATSVIMAAVFVPVAFLGGFTGRIYQQFALTIAISVALSALVALTLTPALAAIFLKRQSGQKTSTWMRVLHAPGRWFNKGFGWVTHGYMAVVRVLVRLWVLALGLAVAIVAVSYWLYEQTPSTLIPSEDQAIALASITLPDAASLARTTEYVLAVADRIEQIPGVEYVSAISGYNLLTGSANTARGSMFINMVPWGERESSADQIIEQVNGLGAKATGGSIRAFNLPAIPGLSTTGGFTGFLQAFEGAGPEALGEMAGKVMQAANQREELSQVFTTFNANVPTYRADINQRKALSYGVSIRDLNATLSNTLGSGFVNYFAYQNRNFQVYLQNEDEFRRSPKDLSNIFVRGGSGERIPLAEFVILNRISAPAVMTRYNIYTAAQFQGGPAAGYSSGQAISAMQAVVGETLGDSWGMGWSGTAYQEVHTGNTSLLALAFGLVMVFLILAAQYESWSLPVAVLTAVPFAFFGAIGGIALRGLEISVYVQVGILVVVGLAAKNAILIVEFAELQRKEAGMSIREAAVHAAELRFRPIVMTSLAFIFGTLPLALASGASQASSHDIGTTVAMGMLSVAVLSSLFVPSFYTMIARLSDWLAGKRRKNEARSNGEQAAGKTA